MNITLHGVVYHISTSAQLMLLAEATPETLPAVLAQLPHTGKTQEAA